uniref:Uncharacterized protein n=1 Tax=Panagrolaimus davidi TaxID=227884 RepID=A0A914PPG6_9BILA
MNSQNSEETKTPMVPPGFEMKNDVENEEKHGKNETSKKSEKEEKNVDESNQVMQNPVTIATVENKDELKALESAVESLEQQSKKSSEEFEDYEKVELLDCNVGAGDQESKNVLSEEKDVESESKTVQFAVRETKNSETAESIQSDAVNVQMNKNDGDKPKIVTFEEMFAETELENVQHDSINTKDSGANQQNVESPPAAVEIMVSKADHKSPEPRELDAFNVQKPRIAKLEEMFVPTAEEKNVENESKTVQFAVTKTKNSETDQQNAEPIESVNVQMDENVGEKPKIVTLEEMFDETESEKVQHDVIDTKDSGADQQNLKSMITSVKDNDSEAKSDKQREFDVVNVQKTEIYNVDPHAVTVASNVEHFKVISKTKSVDKEQSNNEADKIQQEEKSIIKNESNEIKEFLDTVLMIVNTESGDKDKSKVPQDKVVEEESIPKNAKFEMGQKVQCETAIVDSKVHNKSESDKIEVFAAKVDVEKKKESIQPKIVQEGKDQSLKSDIGVDTKDVNSGTDNVLKVSDISLEGDGETKNDGKVAALASDESQTNEQHQIQPAKGLVKSFSKTLINIFSYGNDVTSFNEDVDSESIRDQNVKHENNESSQFYIPNVGKVAAVEEDKKDENIAADKIQVVTKNEVVQNQPIKTFNLFSSENIDAEIERSRLHNDTISQDEEKGHSYSPGFEPEKVNENRQQKGVHVENRVTDEHAEVKENPTEKSSAPMQASETLKDETDKLQQRQQPWNDNNDSWSDVADNVNVGDSASKIGANENIPSNELAILASEPDASENVQPNDSFNLIFDEYFLKFLEIESSNLEVTAIQNFAETIPSDFIVSEDRYPILFKVLFKIKEISNKTIFDESLTVLKKLFWNLDYNKFLVQFWSCEEFKNHENGPIGFSFTEGSSSMVLTGNLPKHERDDAKVNEKAVEAAWSMLLDVEATVTKMLENAFTNKAMNPFYTAVFRKLRCLGEFMIVIDGKNLPIFFYFYYQLFGNSEGNKLITGLTLLVNVCKSHKNENSSALMKPNFVLQEIMPHLICDDEKKEAYMLALKRFFDQPFDLKCEMKWNSESDDFENPAVFFKSFIKNFNRNQKIIDNNVVFGIFEEFKKSLDQSEARIENLEKLDENIEVDWPFVFKIVNLLNIQNFQLKIPESLFMILPDEDMEKFAFFTEEEPSLEKALTAIVELHFVTVDTIPETFYKNLWSSFPPSEKECIDIFASSVIQAYNNLKSTIDVKFGVEFIDFIQQICEVLLEKNVIQQISRTFGTDFEYIKANSYLIVIARTLRAVVEEKIENGNKLPFNSISPFFNSLVNLFSVQSYDLFGKIRNDTRDKFAPWRRGNADCMTDEMSMAINHLLNAIQKDIYFVFDQTFRHTPYFTDVLIYLCKQRSYYGVHHPRLEIILLEKIPTFYEPHGYTRNEQGQYYRNQENRRDDFGQQQAYRGGNNRGGFGYSRGGDNFGHGGYRHEREEDEQQKHQSRDASRGRGNSYRGFGAPDQSGDQNERKSYRQEHGGSSPSRRGYSGFSVGASETNNQNGRGRGGDINVPTNHGISQFNGVNDRPVLGHIVRGRGGDTNVQSYRGFGGDRQSGRGGPPTIRGGGYQGYTAISENAPGNSQNDRQSAQSFSQDDQKDGW